MIRCVKCRMIGFGISVWAVKSTSATNGPTSNVLLRSLPTYWLFVHISSQLHYVKRIHNDLLELNRTMYRSPRVGLLRVSPHHASNLVARYSNTATPGKSIKSILIANRGEIAL